MLGVNAINIEATLKEGFDDRPARRLDRDMDSPDLRPLASQLDRFRDRFTVSGAKNDSRDAEVLANSLRTDTRAFRKLSIAEPQSSSLGPSSLATGSEPVELPVLKVACTMLNSGLCSILSSRANGPLRRSNSPGG
jgi:hypothetical protein